MITKHPPIAFEGTVCCSQCKQPVRGSYSASDECSRVVCDACASKAPAAEQAAQARSDGRFVLGDEPQPKGDWQVTPLKPSKPMPSGAELQRLFERDLEQRKGQSR